MSTPRRTPPDPKTSKNQKRPKSSRSPRARTAIVVVLGAVFAWGGRAVAEPVEERVRPRDTHSFARPVEVVVRHLSLDLTVNFEQRRIAGTATLAIENKAKARVLHLDTDGLAIEGVTLLSSPMKKDSAWEDRPAKHSLGEQVRYLGRPMTIEIEPQTTHVKIHYKTRPEAAALQWLTPEQTAGKQHPFLFTQSQPHLARTWVPIQDSPAIRITYDATVRVPKHLLALMSAENPTRLSPDGVYTFKMPQPVPAYLLALAVGDLRFKPLGSRTGVYAEPIVVEKAAWEFADTEKFMAAAEKRYGPYRWGRYDILVLPPAFPYGGMENPRLTFVSPMLIAGDRSQVATIAHELAHSWSGNLVTNATWDDFWLNEGVTTYLTHRLFEDVYGREVADIRSVLEQRLLDRTIERFGPQSPRTRLHTRLAGGDPEDSFSRVPYIKGDFFLRLVEAKTGREAFDGFLRGYFDTFAFRSMDTRTFEAYLQRQLLDRYPDQGASLQVKRWLYETGVPENRPTFSSSRLARVDAQLKALAVDTPPDALSTKGWTTYEWEHFIGALPRRLSSERLKRLDDAFGFTASGNSEILREWFRLTIPNDYPLAYDALERFLLSNGRRKYLRPLYTALAATPAGLARARRIYAKGRPTYHPVAQREVDDVLGTAAR